MAKEEWGVEARMSRRPANGSTTWNKNPIVSPYTGRSRRDLDTGKGKRSLVADKSDKSASAKAETEEEELVLEEEEDIVLDDLMTTIGCRSGR